MDFRNSNNYTSINNSSSSTTRLKFPPFLQCTRTGNGEWRCQSMVAPGRSYCAKHYHEQKIRNQRKRERKLASLNPRSIPRSATRFKKMEKRKRGAISDDDDDDDCDESEEEVSETEFFMKRIMPKGFRFDDAEIEGESTSNLKEKKKKMKKVNTSVGEDVRGYYRLKKIGGFGEGMEITKNAKTKRKRRDSSSGQDIMSIDEEDRGLPCHQCLQRFEVNVVVCLDCHKTQYCFSCLAKWYPDQTREDLQDICPACRGICNCKQCLRENMLLQINRKQSDDSARLKRLLYLLNRILPLLRQIHEEHNLELDMEAKIQGAKLNVKDVTRIKLDKEERVYCDNCHTSVVDFHRSCSHCSYDLCLACCRELRDGHQPGATQTDRDHLQFSSQSQDVNMKGIKSLPAKRFGCESQEILALKGCDFSTSSQYPDWRPNADGSIPCPAEERGGCGNGFLNLKRSFKANWLPKLLKEAENLTASCQFMDDISLGCSMCSQSYSSADGLSNLEVRQAAFRENNNDNFLYSPRAINLGDNDMEHFQKHWIRGEPVIVRGVFEKTTGLSWDPMAMWRAVSERKMQKFKDEGSIVKAIECYNWGEVEINVHQFFEGYTKGRVHENGWPEMLKLKDWPSSSLFEYLPRHAAEFIAAVPFHQYTDPKSGLLNLASKFPDYRPKPDLGPRVYIDYGFPEELSRGDSVTKIHCNISDTVNILTHTAEVKLTDWQYDKVKQLKEMYRDGDSQELYIDVSEIVLKNVEQVTLLPTKNPGTKDSCRIEPMGSFTAMPNSLEKTEQSSASDNMLMRDHSSSKNQEATLLDKQQDMVLESKPEKFIDDFQAKEKLKIVEAEAHNLIEPIPAPSLEDLSAEIWVLKDVGENGFNGASGDNLFAKKMLHNDGINSSGSHDNSILKSGFPECDNFHGKSLLLDNVKQEIQVQDQFNNQTPFSLVSTKLDETSSHGISSNSSTCPSELRKVDVKDELKAESSSEGNHGGAVWDIFRKQDVPKLIEYLQKHWREFSHINNLPINSVVHPIHDQTVFLNEYHKKQLKKEFNVEPWTFEQHLGEAVFIPAGCPHQMRNRQSCTKLAIDFVSAENVGECLRLTEEFRLLPKTHQAKVDKLEVKKMIIFAASSALREATELTSKFKS